MFTQIYFQFLDRHFGEALSKDKDGRLSAARLREIADDLYEVMYEKYLVFVELEKQQARDAATAASVHPGQKVLQFPTQPA